MKTEEAKSICRAAIAKYGISQQVAMAHEEMGELVVALHHLKRGKATVDDVITEIADVTIMIYQLAEMFGVEKVQAEIDRKLKRLSERMNNQQEEIFPQLAESEDERIRKWIYNMVENLGYPADEAAEKELEEMQPRALAYLDKQKEQKVDIDKLRRDIYQSGYNDGYQHGKEDAQKEQKPAIKLVFPKFRVGDIICNVHDESDKTTKRISYVGEHGYNFDYRHLGDKAGGGSFGFCYEDYYELVEQKPDDKVMLSVHKPWLAWLESPRQVQNPEWNNLDKGILNDAITAVDLLGNDESFNKGNPNLAKAFRIAKDWLKSLPERFNLQSKQEWSEEDEAFLKVAIAICNRYSHKDVADWLKSLRPQPKAELTLLDENIIEAAVAFVEQNDHFNVWRGIDKHTVLKALRSLKPHWKPSEEQMKALKEVAYNIVGTGTETDVHQVQLYEHLKAL